MYALSTIAHGIPCAAAASKFVQSGGQSHACTPRDARIKPHQFRPELNAVKTFTALTAAQYVQTARLHGLLYQLCRYTGFMAFCTSYADTLASWAFVPAEAQALKPHCCHQPDPVTLICTSVSGLNARTTGGPFHAGQRRLRRLTERGGPEHLDLEYPDPQAHADRLLCS